ncbi:hypothetical protein [Piscinibacter terrae]|uniref:DUF3800 domain-containing protein n=1 Tax=Piscinibacter terrae TaxID=2496871 RepID=A0A3N7HVE2_9BURK|nr:hypothetical protein [Albitalea terrae]RQP26274.1 hypothetical protein DZC73_04385 [Albitalea terrae]
MDRIMQHERLEDMPGPLIHMFSDYGGRHKASLYETTAVLYMDVNNSASWQADRLRVRQRYLPDGRRMSFKGLNDVMKQQALIPFLEATDAIPGVLLVVAVHKSVKNLCWGNELRTSWPNTKTLHHRWSPRAFERALSVAHLVGLMVGGLSTSGQEIYWFSDEDELLANQKASKDVGSFLSLFSSAYVTHPLKQVGLGTTAIDEGDRYEEDHVTITDLAAGAAADMLTELARHAGSIPTGIAVEFHGQFSPKTNVITSWLGDSRCRLKKVLMVFDPRGTTGFWVMRLNW